MVESVALCGLECTIVQESRVALMIKDTNMCAVSWQLGQVVGVIEFHGDCWIQGARLGAIELKSIEAVKVKIAV